MTGHRIPIALAGASFALALLLASPAGAQEVPELPADPCSTLATVADTADLAQDTAESFVGQSAPASAGREIDSAAATAFGCSVSDASGDEYSYDYGTTTTTVATASTGGAAAAAPNGMLPVTGLASGAAAGGGIAAGTAVALRLLGRIATDRL